ncbi:MAG: acyl-CoA dehydrogenase family protein [Proteobacteria bacterium]|nr:acyl-CoA dehydrogenase family protein [Pseudomonadota bacterium]
MFEGSILENNLYPYPQVNETESETLKLVLDSIDKFLSPLAENFREYDVKGEQPKEYIQSLKDLGLFGLIIPEEFGGIGFSNRAYARVVEQLSFYDGSTALTVAAHSSIGMKGLLLFGTAEQKKKYLPKLASGEMIASFCLTESGSGSDAASIKTTAEKNADGSWTLTGEKIWITNGAFADFFTVFAKSNTDAGKITAFIVERTWAGVGTGVKEDKMGIRSSATTTVTFDNVKIPAEAVLGEEGKGFKVAMAILNNGRTGLGGGSVGAMKRCIELATKQATERKQFNKKISEFGLVQEKISQMAALCFATESVVGMVANYIDSGVEDYSVEAAISKIFASESLWYVSNEALQIAGGNGFMRHFPYERIVRDCRINLIFEGTNEILRLYVALSGLKDAGTHLKEIGKSVANIFNDPIKGFGVLSDYATKRFAEITKIGGDKFEKVHPELKEESAFFEKVLLQLSKESAAVLKKYRDKIVDQQFQQKRLAELVIDTFVGFSVLSRVTTDIEAKGLAQCANEIKLAKLFTKMTKVRISENLRGIEREDDKLFQEVASNITENGKYLWDIV